MLNVFLLYGCLHKRVTKCPLRRFIVVAMYKKSEATEDLEPKSTELPL